MIYYKLQITNYKGKVMKYLIPIFTVFMSFAVSAGGRTNWAVPTQIDVERGSGIMVYGEFGNPNQCSVSNRFYIKIEHPQYDKIYSAVLAAFSSGDKIRVYSHACEPVTWYSVISTTYNVLNNSGDFSIKK